MYTGSALAHLPGGYIAIVSIVAALIGSHSLLKGFLKADSHRVHHKYAYLIKTDDILNNPKLFEHQSLHWTAFNLS